MSPINKSCLFCKSWIPNHCKTCKNVETYFCNMKMNAMKESEMSGSVSIEFPGPGKVENSPIYGNYVVASRTILEGEIIIEEIPLTMSPYGPSDRLPYCLACYTDISFSAKCSKCKWPICNKQCEMVYVGLFKSFTFTCNLQMHAVNLIILGILAESNAFRKRM